MNNALETDDGEETRGDGSCCNGAQDDQSQQASGVASTFSLEEEITARSRAGGGGSHNEWIVEGDVNGSNNVVQLGDNGE